MRARISTLQENVEVTKVKTKRESANSGFELELVLAILHKQSLFILQFEA